MSDSLTSALMVTFDGGRLTSDGGLVWLAQADDHLGLSAAFSRQIRDWRRGPVHHPLRLLVRQRILQIACGYEDQDDADTLRHDPLLKLVCGRLPERGADLASQPTLSRLENAADGRTCYRLAQTLIDVYLQERERAGVPDHVLLDLDSTADPTHGEQEGSSYHGYYRQHMYHPLLIFDGHTNQLITAVLRHGTVHASHGVVAILSRLLTALRRRWPAVHVELRADSGFAVPALYDYCEREHLDYTIGLAPNSRLQALASPLVEQAKQQHTATGAKVRLLAEGLYAADSWAHERRVIYKAEEVEKGSNLRFVVTSRTDLDPLALYNWYVRRGEPELWIKDLKDACFADRLSCHRFWANQFRLLLHAAAYWLLDTLRRSLMAVGMARMQLDTLRLRVIKIGGWVREHLQALHLHLASSHPGEPFWHLLAAHFNLRE
ncbi:MAG TPA: IS1380 family transposase [Ktedonobacterales bacterium]|nr:IS1380 family transposase [Ktedonobacterales bacterium]